MALSWDDDLKHAKKSRFTKSAVRSKFLALVDDAKSKMFEEDYIDEVAKIDRHQIYKFELRASKLPFCTMLEMHRTLTKMVVVHDYSFDFYTSIGTAVHTTLQNNFPEAKKTKPHIFGNWACTNAKTEGVRCDYRIEKSVTPKSLVCPKCAKKDLNGKLEYEELHFIHEGELGCHIDGVLRFDYGKKAAKKLKRKHFYIPLEYKTTSQTNIDMPHLFLPIEKHIFQAFTYVMVMRAAGYYVPGFIIAYFSRDKSKKGKAAKAKQTRKAFYIKVDEDLLKEHIGRMDKTINSARLAKFVMKLDDAEAIKKQMKNISALRPCRSKEDFDDYMKHTFFGKETCPFACEGGCFSRDAKTPVSDKLAKMLIKQNVA